MIGKSGTATDEPIDRRRKNHRAHLGNSGRIGGIDLGRKPSLQRRLGNNRHAAVFCHTNPLLPLLGACRRRCTGKIANNHAIDAIGMLLGKTESGRAAQ